MTPVQKKHEKHAETIANFLAQSHLHLFGNSQTDEDVSEVSNKTKEGE
jgi:hypothetical protein